MRAPPLEPSVEGTLVLSNILLPGVPPRARSDPSMPSTPAPYFKYAGLGIQFALTFLVFGAIGWWLDAKLGTAPWLMIVFIALGAAGAFWSLIRSVPPAGRGSETNRGEQPPRQRR